MEKRVRIINANKTSGKVIALNVVNFNVKIGEIIKKNTAKNFLNILKHERIKKILKAYSIILITSVLMLYLYFH